MKSPISHKPMAIALSSFGALLLAGGLVFAADADQNGHRDPWQNRRHSSRMSFQLGLCVGQSLSQQGVSLPAPTPGSQPQELDSSTQAAFQSAIETCRSEMEGNSQPSPSPSSTPTAAPTATPTATAPTEDSPSPSSS